METGDGGVVADVVRVAILIVVRSLYICFFLKVVVVVLVIVVVVVMVVGYWWWLWHSGGGGGGESLCKGGRFNSCSML